MNSQASVPGARLRWLATGGYGVAISSILVAAMALILRLLLAPILPLPQPAIQDEFSYLLAADTFAHGRLTNPVHPMWIHFETFHELSHPTYASKYPPGQGLVVALGQMFHAPWAAVWISMAVLSGLVTWAAWIWFEPGWAIAAGLLVALQLTGTYWTESYWGGTVAAIGGALLVGALGRLLKENLPRAAVIFAVGLAILANTRPYEGLVLGFSCAVILLAHLISSVHRARASYFDLLRSVGLPIAAVLLPTLAWMAYYNYRVSGNALRLPYSVYDQQYAMWSQFLWSNHARPAPKYNHEILRTFWMDWDGTAKHFQRRHILKVHLINLITLCQFFLGWPLTLCLMVSFPRLLRDRQLRGILLLLLLFYLGLSFEANLLPHYFAPATVLVFLVATAAVRAVLSRFSPGRATNLATTALVGMILLFAVGRLTDPGAVFMPDRGRQEAAAQRERVVAFISQHTGQHLVLVEYGPHHDVHWEWVFNDADIDRSSIVWARSMSREMNEELLRYYPDRHVWTLYVGE